MLFWATCWSNITRLLNTAIIGPSARWSIPRGSTCWPGCRHGALRMPPDFCASAGLARARWQAAGRGDREPLSCHPALPKVLLFPPQYPARGNAASARIPRLRRKLLAARAKRPDYGRNEEGNARSTGRVGQSGANLRRRPVRHGLHRLLYLSDPALRAVAGDEREPDRPLGRRPLAAGGVPVDPYRRADGPVRHAPGDLVFRLVGDRAGAGIPAGAVVLGAVALAGRQRRRAQLRLVGSADADRPARRGRGRIYRPVQLLRPDRHDRRADTRRGRLGSGRGLARLYDRERCGVWC